MSLAEPDSDHQLPRRPCRLSPTCRRPAIHGVPCVHGVGPTTVRASIGRRVTGPASGAWVDREFFTLFAAVIAASLAILGLLLLGTVSLL